MIGVVGPSDSSALVQSVADEIGLSDKLVLRPYRNPSETETLVRKLNEVCSVILFTGRLPYSIARAAGLHASGFDYIPHEGPDLFRFLALLALKPAYTGRIPSLSFDSIPQAGVAEAYKELGIRRSHHVIPLEIKAEAGSIQTARIIEAHRKLYVAGKVEHCGTCINSVYEALAQAGVPASRIVHSRITVRQALRRAELLLELERADASQLAVAILQRTRAGAGKASLEQAVQECANALGGTVMRVDGREGLLLTTRAGVERGQGTWTPQMRKDDPEFVLGIGAGSTAKVAELQARQACRELIKRPDRVVRLRGKLCFAVGTLERRLARPAQRRHASDKGHLPLSSAVIHRLLPIFREIDASGFTAEEFARGYNIQPRSARRLLGLLKQRGLVQECGSEAGNGAGRPKHLYRIFIDQLAGPFV